MDFFSSILTKVIEPFKIESLDELKFSSKIKLQFQRTDAVKYRCVLGHKFQAKTLIQPTYCSQCGEFCYGFIAQACKLCDLLVCHEGCLLRIDTRCAKEVSSETTNSIIINGHKLRKKRFLSPTFCNHCGTLIMYTVNEKGIYSGFECDLGEGGCGVKIHSSCSDKISNHCSRRERQNIPRLLDDNSLEDEFSLSREAINDIDCSSSITFEDFEPIKILGRGSLSKVVLVKFKKAANDREFAIKVIKKTNEVIASDPKSVFTERKILNFGGPFLATVYCCFQNQARLYLVMEYVIGRDLFYYTLEKCEKFSEERTRFYSAEIFLALKYLHNKFVIHRDLKLENIILEQSGHVKLIDFGMSKELNQAENQSSTKTFCGTPRYISPETIREDEYDYSVDWWAFGVLIYEMLLGMSPFDDGSSKEEDIYKNILEEEDPLRKVSKRCLSEGSRDLLIGLLKKYPKERLGCREEDGYEKAIERHQFFCFDNNNNNKTSDEQWDDVMNKRIRVPFKPSSMDIDHSDEVKEELNLTHIDPKQLAKISQDDFRGFSYCSDSFKLLRASPLIQF